MTDVLAALAALSQQPGTATSEAFTDFYQRWQSEPLVIDKWFTLQAMSCHADTLDVVSKLLAHPAFTYRNPNRVRALLGAFAQSNPGAFHRDDGAGYRLLGSEILHIDPLNPQLATRLAGALSRWRRYRAPLRDAMRHELERLAGTSLSRDLYEVVNKSLEGE
jgi:aminopeptidase N